MIYSQTLVTQIGFDTAEDEPPKVCIGYRSPAPSPLWIEFPNTYRSGDEQIWRAGQSNDVIVLGCVLINVEFLEACDIPYAELRELISDPR